MLRSPAVSLHVRLRRTPSPGETGRRSAVVVNTGATMSHSAAAYVTCGVYPTSMDSATRTSPGFSSLIEVAVTTRIWPLRRGRAKSSVSASADGDRGAHRLRSLYRATTRGDVLQVGERADRPVMERGAIAAIIRTGLRPDDINVVRNAIAVTI